MLNLARYLSLSRVKTLNGYLLPGDKLVILLGLLLLIYLFQTLWTNAQAAKVQIQVGDKVYATFSLNQAREVQVKGKLGEATISIANGKVRFAKSPCHSQYCVHQGWLTRAGQASICLPNQISLALIGEAKPYDSLNY